MILLVDNYDSFVHNLARYVRELEQETVVVRNDEVSVDDVVAMTPSHIIISPGPRSPEHTGISVPLIRAVGREIPILGVCLGHQCIATAFGGRVVGARRPMHGKASWVRHSGAGLFRGVPSPFPAGRYHSLAIDPDTLPACLEVAAVSVTEGVEEIMAVRHRSWPVWGVQFHPESILTHHGHTLLGNFLALGPGAQSEANLEVGFAV